LKNAATDNISGQRQYPCCRVALNGTVKDERSRDPDNYYRLPSLTWYGTKDYTNIVVTERKIISWYRLAQPGAGRLNVETSGVIPGQYSFVL